MSRFFFLKKRTSFCFSKIKEFCPFITKAKNDKSNVLACWCGLTLVIWLFVNFSYNDGHLSLWNFYEISLTHRVKRNTTIHLSIFKMQQRKKWLNENHGPVYIYSLYSLFFIFLNRLWVVTWSNWYNSKKAPSNNNNKRFSCSLGIYIVSIISFKRSISCVRKWIVSSIQARHVIDHSSVITTLKTTASDICDSLLL